MKYVIIAGVIILTIFLVILSQIPKGIEPLTELYFTQHLELPKTVQVNQTYNFSFSVHNLEYKAIIYQYEVIGEYNNKTVQFDINSIGLDNNQTKTVEESFKINENFDRAKISVNLLNREEVIHFWVDEE
ncbi:MAG: hypothetical protein V1663_04325 [archaeon]